MDLGCLMNFSVVFFRLPFYKYGVCGKVESQGMRLGLRGAPHWVTRGTHPRVFFTYVSI